MWNQKDVFDDWYEIKTEYKWHVFIYKTQTNKTTDGETYSRNQVHYVISATWDLFAQCLKQEIS